MKANHMNKANATKFGARRKANGSSLLEIPVVLWLTFVVLMMPLLSMATITLRSALMNCAVQDGAHDAAKARTFETGTADKPSAVVLAQTAIKRTADKFSGLVVDSVQTNIVTTPVAAGAVQRQASKLTIPADTSRFIYQIETVANGHIDPPFRLNADVFGRVPGLTTPVAVSYVAREMAENPQGLNQ